MDQFAVEAKQPRRVGIAQFPRTAGNQVEHGLWIAGRGRHHLEHVDGRGLMFDPLAVFAVARRQFGAALVELPLEFRDGLLGIGCRHVERRGHAPTPARGRTSSEERMCGMIPLFRAQRSIGCKTP